MKVKMFYRKNSEKERIVEEYIRDFERQTGGKIELVDIDSPDGVVQGSLYDVTRVPALVAVRDDSQMVQMWANDQLPLFSEVSYYTQGQLDNAAVGAL